MSYGSQTHNPNNTTSADGAACIHCGDDASGVSVIDHRDVPTCDACFYDQTDTCGVCGEQFWMVDMIRVGAGFECSACVKVTGHGAGCQMTALARDEQRDDMNETRR